LHKRLFRPVGSPGVVLVDGRIGGAWRMAKGEVVVEALGPLPRGQVDEEAARVAALRHA